MARVRAKKNIPTRMERCNERWFENPMENKGHWKEFCKVPQDNRIFLEIGCGKGKFACDTVSSVNDVLYFGLERDSSVVLAAIERAHELEVPDLYFFNADAGDIDKLFDEGEVDRIFINFCDPWSKKRKPKRRLTYRDYLTIYKRVLKKDGQIFFKTDDDALFDFSLEEFKLSGFTLSELTYDLHNSEFDANNIRTEFETKFSEQGIKIKRVVASL